MAYLSKKEYSKDVERTLKKFVADLILSKKRYGKEHPFLELLTETELLTFGKRILLMHLLKKGWSYYKIKGALAVSTSTIKRYSLLLEQNTYPHIEQWLRAGEERQELLDFIDTLSRLGLPPIAGIRTSRKNSRKQRLA